MREEREKQERGGEGRVQTLKKMEEVGQGNRLKEFEVRRRKMFNFV